MIRAISFSRTGPSSVLLPESVAIPVPRTDQILIRNSFIGINFIDTYHRSGLYPVKLPYIPGREAVGIVHDSNHSSFENGDVVAYLATNTYAEYALADSKYVFKLPDNIHLPSACAILLQGITAISLINHANISSQSRVLACVGGTGSLIAQICKSIGAHVTGTTSSTEKLNAAKELGIDKVVLYTVDKELKEVEDCDVVFDGIGASTFSLSLSKLKLNGHLVSFGNASGKVPPIEISCLTKNCVKISRPSMFEFIKTREEFLTAATKLFSFFSKGLLKVHIHKIYNLEDVKDAHDDLESGKTRGKLLLKV